MGGHASASRGTLQRTPAGLVVEEPKTDRARRDTAVAFARSDAPRAPWGAAGRQLLAGEAWTDGDYLLDRGDGQLIDPDALGRAFRRARERTGLDGVRLHDLRDGFASILVNAETNPRVVSDLLGHATVAFTLQTYFHPGDDAAADAVAKAEKLLGWGG
jgi:integrase